MHEDDLVFNFLDSEQSYCQGNGSPLSRPWTSYWPPKRGNMLYLWLEAEYPEALTWRFDPRKPFNRPWQIWTRKAKEIGAACKTVVLMPQDNFTSQCDAEAGKDEKEEEQEEAREEAVDRVNKEIEALGLHSTIAKGFCYLAPEARYRYEKPFHSRLPFLDGLRRNNIVSQQHNNVCVYDISGFEDCFTLPVSGFTFLKVPVNIATWTEEVVRNSYLPLMELWLKHHFRSELVHIYAYNFRCQDQKRTLTEPWIEPFMRAHCDVTTNSSISRLKLHLPENAEEIQKSRYRFVNIWRPLTSPYQDCPLAVCDYRSVSCSDLVAADIVFPHYCDEGYEVKYTPKHRWFYKRGMSVDDMILFKLFDSCPFEAKFCPHTAFFDETAPPETQQRASIELRAIVVG